MTTALYILNDPIMRITMRFFTPLDRNEYYFERDMNEMLYDRLANNEFTNTFKSNVKFKL